MKIFKTQFYESYSSLTQLTSVVEDGICVEEVLDLAVHTLTWKGHQSESRGGVCELKERSVVNELRVSRWRIHVFIPCADSFLSECGKGKWNEETSSSLWTPLHSRMPVQCSWWLASQVHMPPRSNSETGIQAGLFWWRSKTNLELVVADFQKFKIAKSAQTETNEGWKTDATHGNVLEKVYFQFHFHICLLTLIFGVCSNMPSSSLRMSIFPFMLSTFRFFAFARWDLLKDSMPWICYCCCFSGFPE